FHATATCTGLAQHLVRPCQIKLVWASGDKAGSLDGSITVVANSFQGRQLNRPKVVVVKSDGCIYFPDPWTNPAAPQQWDLTFSGVYRMTRLKHRSGERYIASMPYGSVRRS